jgi:hypothetical protein
MIAVNDSIRKKIRRKLGAETYLLFVNVLYDRELIVRFTIIPKKMIHSQSKLKFVGSLYTLL